MRYFAPNYDRLKIPLSEMGLRSKSKQSCSAFSPPPQERELSVLCVLTMCRGFPVRSFTLHYICLMGPRIDTVCFLNTGSCGFLK